jgi:hypothetical protein
MDLSNYKIAIFTRSMNYSLYKVSKNTILLPFKHYRLTYTTAHGYIYKILKYDIDYAINIDEDAFVLDNDALLKLLEYCITEKIINCGMRDGGVLPIRFGNPVVTNPFFNILDVKRIKKDFSISTIIQNLDKKIDYSQLIPTNLPFKFEITNDYEPFYPFFLWLNTNYKTLYLSVNEHEDGYTTILYNQLDQPMIYHSWFSRCYGVDEFHTQRILKLYNSCVKYNIEFSFFERSLIKFEKFLNQQLIPLILPIRRKIKNLINK